MMKKVIFSVLLALGSLASQAQEFSVEKLKQDVWRQQTNSTTEKTISKFSDSIENLTFSVFWKGQWKSSSVDYPYYLSPTIPQTFDFNKVGKGEAGKYLVTWNDKMKEFYVLEIVSLSDTCLQLKTGIIDRGAIGGSDTLIYKRVIPESR